MRDNMMLILRIARHVQEGSDLGDGVKEMLGNIETEAMRALQGDKVIVPSNVFGDIDIPKDVITGMSNGDDDLWFSHGCALDINIFYVDGWQFNIYPVKNGEIDTENTIEAGKL